MTRHTKRVIGAVGIVLLVFAVFIGILFATGVFNSKETQPKQPTDASSDQPRQEARDTTKEESPAKPDTSAEDEAKKLDPATLGTVDITPVSLTVSYVKGVGGFEYEVLRASGGRKYVELRNEKLIGTKCNDDVGVFVSIVEAPNESEKATISKTTDVDGVQYGLSVASPTCTSDPELLQQYQDAFSKPFGLLKKLN
ncbi:hypothetical protein KI440_01615 [Candidatus Saccharibacteria bacterium TM7i]|nr:hypothetical protein KI440_01615 [Candidatus Saccharibacteria bacterium TM7i]